jgi:trehalose/maltose hydrolase-like predicted phosphorylase
MNGKIGLRLGRDSMGNNLPMFAIDCYTHDAEENIRPLPNPLSGSWTVGQTILSPLHGSDYEQVLDMHSGRLVTSWSQAVADKADNTLTVKVRATTVLHPETRTLAQRWTIIPSRPVNAFFHASLPQSLSVSKWKGFGLASAGEVLLSMGKDSPTLRAAYSVANPEQLDWAPSSLRANFIANPGVGITLDRIFQVSPTNFDSRMPTFDKVQRQTSGIWARRWKTDIIIDGPEPDQQAIRSWLFYLQSAINEDEQRSVSPMALSSNTYNGHVFWDADTWVFPALALVAPEKAGRIAGYRVAHLPQAKQAFAMLEKNPGVEALRFPWESAVTGTDVAPAKFQKQQHVTGDVAMMLEQGASLGLVPQRTADSVAEQAAAYYRYLAFHSDPTGKNGLDIAYILGPNEYSLCTNDLYTNCLAQILQDRWGKGTSPFPPNIPIRYKLPRDRTSLVTYENDPLRNYQQAAAVLAIYPLQFPQAEKEAPVMMERFPPRTNAMGPAMTNSVQAVIWARLGERQRAYTEWLRSWADFSSLPLNQFSERRRIDRTYFVTGAGGCLQSVLYGFLGFRIDLKKDPHAVWAKKLHGGSWLSLKPHLPEQWKSVTLRNFTVLGQHFTLTATHNGTTVSQGEL